MIFSQIVETIRTELQAYFTLGGVSEDKYSSLTNAMAEGYVNEALLDLSTSGCINERRDLSTATYDATSNTSSLILPADLLKIANVSYVDAGKLKPLIQITNNLSMQTMSGTYPMYYWIYDEVNTVSGEPQKRLVISGDTQTYHIVADVYVLHATMQITDTVQTLRIPAQYHLAVLNYGKSKAYDLAATCMSDAIKSQTALSQASKFMQLYLKDKQRLTSDSLWYGKTNFAMQKYD